MCSVVFPRFCADSESDGLTVGALSSCSTQNGSRKRSLLAKKTPKQNKQINNNSTVGRTVLAGTQERGSGSSSATELVPSHPGLMRPCLKTPSETKPQQSFKSHYVPGAIGE